MIVCNGQMKRDGKSQALNGETEQLAKYSETMSYTRTEIIERAWDDRSLLQREETREQILATIELLDQGKIRVAEPDGNGWKVNQWVKKAVILYFPLKKMETMEAGPVEYHDKIPLKHNFASLGIRVVPGAVARYGAFISSGVILMPSFVNIGSWIGEGTMVDTWATVGSCAQIGKHVHLSGGVGIGGVLEPVQASPVIIGDNCFLGSRSVVVEGARIDNEAVLGANVVITGTTRIIDVSGEKAAEYRGYVPPRSVVIPGTVPKVFPAGSYNVPCALIIGTRKESTDKKTSLNDALREYDVAF
jgi:2,3,4,5-tetrahydropyridine-2,6-dicarboxylate N-succinyltransferase